MKSLSRCPLPPELRAIPDSNREGALVGRTILPWKLVVGAPP